MQSHCTIEGIGAGYCAYYSKCIPCHHYLGSFQLSYCLCCDNDIGYRSTFTIKGIYYVGEIFAMLEFYCLCCECAELHVPLSSGLNELWVIQTQKFQFRIIFRMGNYPIHVIVIILLATSFGFVN